MAHFAEIDNNGVVLRVLVVADEQEHRGQEFLANDCNLGSTWIQTSFNSRIRKHFAGAGMTYREDLDAFIPIKCHDEATLNENTCVWECTNTEHSNGDN